MRFSISLQEPRPGEVHALGVRIRHPGVGEFTMDRTADFFSAAKGIQVEERGSRKRNLLAKGRLVRPRPALAGHRMLGRDFQAISAGWRLELQPYARNLPRCRAGSHADAAIEIDVD